eukprot:CAMPEP_0202857520 /NCGR_PEP_ID=MMETSP1391-20130828/425_1 /ASSEMBLY_ACC=CAM_ASM_000867 /TAXON_ID=1034604 /ORGANISM="Chlamydomonas leiostraca, Strain SAG 11-49" /LENGTH=191 /DNA_ID=CAMNT_0049536329 /DNA_START=188 /DNA_END=764 /DNA_ORIENTATION=+
MPSPTHLHAPKEKEDDCPALLHINTTAAPEAVQLPAPSPPQHSTMQMHPAQSRGEPFTSTSSWGAAGSSARTSSSAVLGAGVQASVALAADHLVLVVLAGQDLQGGLNDATAQAQHQVEGGLLLDVVVSQGAAVLQLLAGEDQTLLVRRNALLVLDLLLHILDGVGGLHLEGDSLAREGLHEDLHLRYFAP